jgi:two-component system phosphate regulon sensor histidine kinase PhoR
MKVEKSKKPLRLMIEDSPQIFLTEIMENLREGVVIVKKDLRVVASNKAARTSFPRLAVKQKHPELHAVIADEALRKTLTHALKKDEASEVKIQVAVSLTDKRTYDVRVAPLKLEGKKHAIGIFYDITRLERLERVRQEFLSNVSHELRTPLTSILAFVETLEDGALSDRSSNKKFLAIIRKNAERMHRLIDDILELSAIEAGRVTVKPKKVNLEPLSREVAASLAARARERKVKLKNEITEDNWVRADGIRLEQMLTNLVENAIKFNRAGGSVTISATRNGKRDLISVTDTGAGISSQHLPRIFERFYQADRARSNQFGGTGLGLAIVKHLARLHGGEIAVKSAHGKGSTFTIELPAHT